MPSPSAPTITWTTEESTRLIAFSILYFVAASIGNLFLITPDGITIIWPASGVFLAAFLLSPRSQWWVIAGCLALIEFAVQMTLGDTEPIPAALVSLIAAIQPFAAATLLRRFTNRPLDFENFLSVSALLAWGIAVPITIFAVPAATIAYFFFETPPLTGWSAWVIAHGLGTLVITPLLVVANNGAFERIKRLSAEKWLETVISLLVLTLITGLVFTLHNPAGETLATYAYVPFVVLIWIAMRLGVGTTTLAIFLFVATAVWFDALSGNESATAMRASVIALETFLFVIVTGSLCLAAVAADRANESQRFQSSEENLRNLIELAPIGIFVGNKTQYLYCNPAGAKIFGLSSPEDIVGLDITTFHHPTEKKAGEERINALLENRELSTRKFEIQIVDTDGKESIIESSAAHFRWNGQPANLAMVSDISDRKHAEEALRRAQKMDAIGQLTGGIAHDFNNILGIIIGNLELVEDSVKDNPEIEKRIGLALNAVSRGVNITAKLLNFSRQKPAETRLISVNEFVVNIQDLLSKSLTAKISIETHLAESLWPVDIDPGELQDALINLALNARDAMPGGGKLIIETENKRLDADYVALNPQAREGEFVMLSVSDTGTGMKQGVAEKIFEPFFSTKAEGKGTGLGLSMVYGFVSQSRGHIKVYSEPGKGSTFRIYLPHAHREATAADISNQKPIALPRGNETVLIVDDETDFIDIAARNLSLLGYTILTASNARDALEVLNANPGIGLLFSDVVMPGRQDGYQLAVEAHRAFPNLKILMTSGFTQRREEFANGDGVFVSRLAGRLLSKPYNRTELANAIRRTLDAAD